MYATKVPRYGEIWWFYPRGQATECTDAIVYNIRENTWYDAGQALGARRSAGYFSQVFRFPINSGTELSVEESIFSSSIDTTNATADIEMVGQHEIGVNEVNGAEEVAINSYFETSDLGWVGGGPSQTGPIGDNFWLHIERIEPDFVQSGEMYCQVIGRPYAQEEDQVSDHYVFEPTTGKIDMREQRRLGRLRFGSNVQNGDYQMGRVLVNANAGDIRGY